jgi:hypothetical protein
MSVTQTTDCVIEVGALYWRDYGPNGGWPWTASIDLAAKFEHTTASTIVANWKIHHHATTFKPDGSVLTPATSLGGVLPLNAVVHVWDGSS